MKRDRIWIRRPSGERLVAILALTGYVGIAAIGLYHANKQRSETAEQQHRAGRSGTPIEQQAATDQQQSANDQSPDRDGAWWSSSAPAEWSLAIVGTITAVLALKTLSSIRDQARETRKAALATRDSVLQADRHFRISNQQWIDAEWSAQTYDRDGGGWTLDIMIKIRNPTKMAIPSKD